MGKKKPASRDVDAPQQGGGGKSKKKNLVIDDDEYSVASEQTEESLVKEESVAPTGGKKGKKKNLKAAQSREEEEDDVKKVEEDGEEADISEMVFSGKKKSKGKKGGDLLRKVSFDILGDEGEDDVQNDEDEPITSFVGKKKPSKGPKKGGLKTSFALLEEEDNEQSDGDEQDENVQSESEEPIALRFDGKKKSKGAKKSSSLFSASAFDAIGDEEDAADLDDKVDDEVAVISLSGKKKKSKSSKKGPENAFAGSSFDTLDENLDEKSDGAEVDDVVISFTGKKKSSKKKGGSALATLGDDTIAEIVPDAAVAADVLTSNAEANDSGPANVPVVAETSKNKKKKKKANARTVQEEDDLDKILAELGEAPPVSKPGPSSAPTPPLKDEKLEKPAESASLAEGDKEGEEQGGAGETAAAKKKKKKKEKEKEKKAAAATAEVKKEEVKNEKTKAVDKKLPKHVREMQEALARRQEAEERMKREEEERLRKEEEERIKQEEIERLAQEAKDRKKEREKEKIKAKREAGLLLTAKQKEEQRRLEMMRNQFLASTGISLPADDGGAPTKRPIYKTKKGKPHQGQSNGAKAQILDEKTKEEEAADVEPVKTEKLEEVVTVEDIKEAAAEVHEDGSDSKSDDDWDAKSWDDTDLALPVKGAFDDEETESLAQSEAKKESKNPVAAPPASVVKPVTAAKKATPQPASVQISESIQKPSEVDAARKNRSKETLVGKKTARSAPTDPNNKADLRSPICCIMGHVDTGKTKLLDCIRGTNVQEGEAGGITQQIGATYFPAANIRERTKELKADAKLNVPGLLVIDTPGHESFTNLRSRGSGLCDIAILVVDIMHGLEPQTIESLNLLKMRNTEFIIALNKVDRLYGWKTCHNAPFIHAIKEQSQDVMNEFNQRLIHIVTQFKEQGLNTELYYRNREMGETYSIVPTSAISGEGIPDMLLLLVQWTQKTMIKKLTFSNKVQCTVLEVKVIEGHGTTIDVVLVNGVLHEADQIVVCGMQGPIVTTIRALLTPHPMKELRIKGTYIHHKEIKAAMGIKITAQGLEHAIAGTGLYVVGPDDDLDAITDLAKDDMDSVMSRIDKSGEGVCVQASTLGSLEALLEFLKSPAVNIPVSAVSIGPVHKKDVMKAGVMLEKKKEYATILAFDVKVTPEAREYADEVGVKIFMADIIYHLFDQFKAYIDNIKEEKKKDAADEAVFPCVLKIIPNCVFNKKDPIVLGVDVVEGIAKVGTPICIPTQDFIDIGRIASIENNHKPVDTAKKGQRVAIKILGSNPEEQQKMFGRHFEIDDELVSHISRKSIDTLKANYRDDLSIEDWKLVVKLKTLLKIQ